MNYYLFEIDRAHMKKKKLMTNRLFFQIELSSFN